VIAGVTAASICRRAVVRGAVMTADPEIDVVVADRGAERR
jgi:hypothetical protein